MRSTAGTTEGSLNGACVALLEARHSGTMASLVELYGGRPYAVPALQVAPIDSTRIGRLVSLVAQGRFSIVVFQTGVAAQRLFDEAERRGMLGEVVDRLKRCTTVCRGPKPAAVLARHGIRPSANVDEPYTTRELLDRLLTLDVSRKYVALLHYGERNRQLGTALRIRGARLAEYLLYEWQLPAETAPLQELVRAIIEGCVDAVAFTNQIQIRHLNLVAEAMGCADALTDALVHRVVVASIGPSCSHALRALGIAPRVVPASPKMRPLIAALSDFFRSSPRSPRLSSSTQ